MDTDPDFFIKKKYKYVFFRHRKENIKKCSLQGLFGREDSLFLSYPLLPSLDISAVLEGGIVLSFEGEEISKNDSGPIIIIDATWRYAEKMLSQISGLNRCKKRTIPSCWKTAYPRYQTGCSDPDRGLASIEALYVAARIMGHDCEELLDHYYFKDLFLKKNTPLK